MSETTSFFERVYEVVRKVPRGRVTTYGAVANFIATGKSARMVGWAMNASHSAHPPVPAQRVVNRNGLLTGKHHFPGENLMQQLLENEGIRVENDLVMDFEDVFWDPGLELDSGNFETGK